MNRAIFAILALLGSTAANSLAFAQTQPQAQPDVEAEHERGNAARRQHRDEEARAIFQQL